MDILISSWALMTAGMIFALPMVLFRVDRPNEAW